MTTDKRKKSMRVVHFGGENETMARVPSPMGSIGRRTPRKSASPMNLEKLIGRNDDWAERRRPLKTKWTPRPATPARPQTPTWPSPDAWPEPKSRSSRRRWQSSPKAAKNEFVIESPDRVPIEVPEGFKVELPSVPGRRTAAASRYHGATNDGGCNTCGKGKKTAKKAMPRKTKRTQ